MQKESGQNAEKLLHGFFFVASSRSAQCRGKRTVAGSGGKHNFESAVFTTTLLVGRRDCREVGRGTRQIGAGKRCVVQRPHVD